MIKIVSKIFGSSSSRDWDNASLILAAKSLMASPAWRSQPDFSNPFWIQDKEFQVYSQFGDDGIIQWLLWFLGLPRCGRFIEFGVGDYYESNTHFLLVNNRWEGYVMDGDEANIATIEKSPMYWRYRLKACRKFISAENASDLVRESSFEKIELLHIDLDGNDYWVLEALDLSTLSPEILILEYNATFGDSLAVAIPYDSDFKRMAAHHSGKYFGASLAALNSLAERKGYYFVGCNTAGNNSYFLPKKYLSLVPPTDLPQGFQSAGFREMRDKNGRLVFGELSDEIEAVKDLPLIDVLTGNVVTL